MSNGHDAPNEPQSGRQVMLRVAFGVVMLAVGANVMEWVGTGTPDTPGFVTSAGIALLLVSLVVGRQRKTMYYSSLVGSASLLAFRFFLRQ